MNKNNDMKVSEEIGGYFGLDLPDHGDHFPDAIKFQSGRAALRAVIESAGIRRLMLPAYRCDSLFQAVADAGADIETYGLDDSLYPRCSRDKFPEGSALLYVNYFGLCEANIARLLQSIPGNQIIVDNCQALFAPPADALANIYSVRKFVGVPDGGLLVSSRLKMNEPQDEDMGSVDRMKHLFLRLAYTAREGYSAFVEAERSLENTRPLTMSRLTKRLLASIDMPQTRRRRYENFIALADRLDKRNTLKWVPGPEAVPLCYPLVVERDVAYIRKSLAEKGVYIPTYWPDAGEKVLSGSIEYRLVNNCLAVPCDQRYSTQKIIRLADEIASSLDKSERI